MHTHLALIVDRSGSMGGKVNDVVGGVNQFIKENCEAPGTAALTIMQFDDQFEIKHHDDVRYVIPWGPEHYKPRGSTALLDAIGRTIQEVGRALQAAPAEKVIVTVITDGQENASREYTSERIKEMMAHAEKHGWTFLFIGADKQAVVAAQGMGFNSMHTSSYANDSIGTTSAYSASAGATVMMRSVPDAHVNMGVLVADQDAKLRGAK